MRAQQYLGSLLLPIALGLSAAAPAEQLVLAIGGEPEDGFDPTRGWGSHGHPLFHSTLINLDADLTLQPGLATDWSVSGDRRRWTLTLREDARFSNGDPVTAEDVAFTFEQAAGTGGLVDLSVFSRAEILSPTEVVFHLREPRVTFTRQLTTLGIVPADHYDPERYNRNLVGSGPFQLVEWRQGEQLIVEPNPYWQGDSLPFDRVTFLFTGGDAAFAMARTGQLDMVAVPPVLADRTLPGMELVNVPSVDNRGIAFPMVPAGAVEREDGAPVGNDVTSSRAIRRAVNVALDREALVDLALAGYGRPAFGPADGLPWAHPDAAIDDSDPSRAREILEQAGWVETSSGVRERDGIQAEFDLLYPASDPVRQALALGVAEQLKTIGVQASPSAGSWTELENRMYADPIVLGWGAHDPLEVWNLYHSSRQGVEYFNTGYYSNESVDAHFAAAQQSDSLEASLPHWQNAHWDGETGFGFRGDAAWAWLVNRGHTYFVSDCLELGPLQPHPHGHGFPITAGIEQWQWQCN